MLKKMDDEFSMKINEEEEEVYLLYNRELNLYYLFLNQTCLLVLLVYPNHQYVDYVLYLLFLIELKIR